MADPKKKIEGTWALPPGKTLAVYSSDYVSLSETPDDKTRQTSPLWRRAEIQVALTELDPGTCKAEIEAHVRCWLERLIRAELGKCLEAAEGELKARFNVKELLGEAGGDTAKAIALTSMIPLLQRALELRGDQ